MSAGKVVLSVKSRKELERLNGEELKEVVVALEKLAVIQPEELDSGIAKVVKLRSPTPYYVARIRDRRILFRYHDGGILVAGISKWGDENYLRRG